MHGLKVFLRISSIYKHIYTTGLLIGITNISQNLTSLAFFQSFKVLGKEIEFGKPGLYIETAAPDLIIAICCEHLTCVDLLVNTK